MRRTIRQPKFTDGQRARALAFVIVGICSTSLGFLAVIHLDREAFFNGLSLYQKWIMAASGLGGMIALFLSGDRMGQRGMRGALRGVSGAIWITFIGALIGGTLSLPLWGTMFGPFIVCVTLMGAPLLSLLWIFNLICLHVLLGIYQAERDSIFVPRRMGLTDTPESLTARLRGRFI